MAGDIKYIGALFDAMITELESLVTKMDTQITNLQAINTSVGQSIQAGKCIASANVKKTVIQAEKDFASTSYTEGGRAIVYANGTLRISARLKTSATDAMGLYYSVDNGTTKLPIKTFAAIVSTYTEYYLDIPISENQEIIIYGLTTGATKHLYMEADSLKFSFDLINVSIDGYIV